MDSAWLRWRSLHLLLSLLALLLLHPFQILLADPWNEYLGSGLLTVVMLSALWWTTGGSRHRTLVMLVALPVVAAIWTRDEFGESVSLVWILFSFYVTARLFMRVMSPAVPIFDRLFTATSVYLLIAINFAYLHILVSSLAPGAYRVLDVGPGPDPSGGDMLYFSFVTILTLGYGDIVPINAFARMLTVVEAFIGTFFIAVLIARLVSLPSWLGDDPA